MRDRHLRMSLQLVLRGTIHSQLRTSLTKPDRQTDWLINVAFCERCGSEGEI